MPRSGRAEGVSRRDSGQPQAKREARDMQAELRWRQVANVQAPSGSFQDLSIFWSGRTRSFTASMTCSRWDATGRLHQHHIARRKRLHQPLAGNFGIRQKQRGHTARTRRCGQMLGHCPARLTPSRFLPQLRHGRQAACSSGPVRPAQASLRPQGCGVSRPRGQRAIIERSASGLSCNCSFKIVCVPLSRSPRRACRLPSASRVRPRRHPHPRLLQAPRESPHGIGRIVLARSAVNLLRATLPARYCTCSPARSSCTARICDRRRALPEINHAPWKSRQTATRTHRCSSGKPTPFGG